MSWFNHVFQLINALQAAEVSPESISSIVGVREAHLSIQDGDLRKIKGTKKVEALSLDLRQTESHRSCFTNEEFEQLQNLRFLLLDGADLDGDFKRLFSKLRWLQWRGCPVYFKPINFHLKNLVILDLSNSRITNNWEGWSQLKMAKRLKVLDLSNCSHLVQSPEFSTFAKLEKLILQGCPNLVQIDRSIGNLRNLRVLDIAYSGITKLPDVIGNLEKLEEMNASSCRKLQGEILSDIGRLSSLRILRLCDSEIRSLPTSICGLSCLQSLHLYNCKQLRLLPKLPPNLKRLDVSSCVSLEGLPDLSQLGVLEELDLCGCQKLVSVNGLWGF
ncbi:hypothetical protein L1049_017575 [Liquidambar formosana]|uniref:Zer-1-like leucine-rich repeats region domain-containing protein n=1 Tax=Liquidambar formosana TaxID=63359 RepID=A0AAP0X7G0_LIQFO